jgi:carbamoyltransferase
MYILGINAFHAGASACLLRDGEVVAAVEEERFRRVKYWAGFPTQSIRYCLAEAGISAYDLTHVGISRNPRANLHKKVWFTLRQRPSVGFIVDRLANAAKVRDPRTLLIEALHLKPANLKAAFHNVEHHVAHMASAFYVSPFQEAAILSVDGMGDFVSTMWGIGRGERMYVLGEIGFPHSLGIFYTAVSQWLGFPKYGDEGKVMGLAPYGRPTYLEHMHKLVRLHRDGTFELDGDAFLHGARGASMSWNDGGPVLGTLYSSRFVQTFGPPQRTDTGVWREISSPSNERYVDVAASLQTMLEEAEFGLMRMLHAKTGLAAVCIAGGVGLNSTFNGKIRLQQLFQDVYIQPAANDAGTSLGVAYYIYHQLLGSHRKYVMSHASLGPGFDDAAIEAVVTQHALPYEVLEEAQLCRAVAHMIAHGNVVGWFQGRMEWGPRALGSRSILADPRREDMKDTLNARIKHREAFRPFAPSILAESTAEYFEQDYPDPFMTKVYTVRPEKQHLIPAVTHVDGTGRLQTVSRATSPLYWQLIKEFECLTGVPVLLNTSFNDSEPIVCTPEEAIDCFLRTKMDVLVLGHHVIRK